MAGCDVGGSTTLPSSSSADSTRSWSPCSSSSSGGATTTALLTPPGEVELARRLFWDYPVLETVGKMTRRAVMAGASVSSVYGGKSAAGGVGGGGSTSSSSSVPGATMAMSTGGPVASIPEEDGTIKDHISVVQNLSPPPSPQKALPALSPPRKTGAPAMTMTTSVTVSNTTTTEIDARKYLSVIPQPSTLLSTSAHESSILGPIPAADGLAVEQHGQYVMVVRGSRHPSSSSSASTGGAVVPSSNGTGGSSSDVVVLSGAGAPPFSQLKTTQTSTSAAGNLLDNFFVVSSSSASSAFPASSREGGGPPGPPPPPQFFSEKETPALEDPRRSALPLGILFDQQVGPRLQPPPAVVPLANAGSVARFLDPSSEASPDDSAFCHPQDQQVSVDADPVKHWQFCEHLFRVLIGPINPTDDGTNKQHGAIGTGTVDNFFAPYPSDGGAGITPLPTRPATSPIFSCSTTGGGPQTGAPNVPRAQAPAPIPRAPPPVEFVFHRLQALCLRNLKIRSLERLPTLCNLSLLEQLDIGLNRISELPEMEHMPRLRRFHADGNVLTSLDCLKSCPNLETVCAQNNRIDSLQVFYQRDVKDGAGIGGGGGSSGGGGATSTGAAGGPLPTMGAGEGGGSPLKQGDSPTKRAGGRAVGEEGEHVLPAYFGCNLSELYLGSNLIEDPCSLILLAKLPCLAILDLAGNPVCYSVPAVGGGRRGRGGGGAPRGAAAGARTGDYMGKGEQEGTKNRACYLGISSTDPALLQNVQQVAAEVGDKAKAVGEQSEKLVGNENVVELPKEEEENLSTADILAKLNSIGNLANALKQDIAVKEVEKQRVLDGGGTGSTGGGGQQQRGSCNSGVGARDAGAQGAAAGGGSSAGGGASQRPAQTLEHLTREYRLYTIWTLRHLEWLDCAPVSSAERQRARMLYSGRLTPALLELRIGYQPAPSFSLIKTLDFSSSFLTDLSDPVLNDSFLPNLRTLILDNNGLKSATIGPLSRLIVLKMNRVKLESLNRLCPLALPSAGGSSGSGEGTSSGGGAGAWSGSGVRAR